MFKPLQNMLLSASLLLAFSVKAQLSITTANTAYNQDFNSLSVSGTSSALPAGWRLLETGTNANTTYGANDGASTTGNTYSYGAGTATERAFGALQSGSLIPVFGLQLANNTGQTISSITISYTGEQWRCGATGRTDRLDFQYSTSATSLNTGTWVDVNTLDFSSPSTTSVGAKNGNTTGFRTALTTTLTGLSIANGAIFWIRWNDFNATSSDDGLSIDDFSLTLNGAASGDTTAPVVSTLTPADGAANIALSGNLQLAFNEAIQKGTGSILIKKLSDNSIAQAIDVATAAVSISGVTATIAYSGLVNSTDYYVEMPAGTFKDLAANNFAGISGNTTWNLATLAASGGGTTTDTLKVMNWNIEWFGSTSNGPQDKNLQQTNVSAVMKNVNADVYALSEVVDINRLQNIVNTMPGYAMIVSDFCSLAPNTSDPDYAPGQKLAFVYRTAKVNKLKAYGVLRAGGSANASYNWSSGRFPYLMEADVTLNGVTKRIEFVLLHGKANTQDYITSYNRRKDGALELRDSLNAQYATSNIIMAGDYNDDLDRTITTQIAPDTTSSYISFLSQPSNFSPVSKALSLAGEKSTVGYNDVIDHVTLSNEMNTYYIAGSVDILRTEVESWIPNYGTTTTDHYPVVSKYFWNSGSPAAAPRIIYVMETAPKTNPYKVFSYQSGSFVNVVVNDSESRKLFVQLVGLNGHVVFRSQTQTVNGTRIMQVPVSHLAKGIYLVKTTSEKGRVVEKIFIQ